MRRTQTSPDRAWTDLPDALAWLKETHGANLPFEREDGKQAYLDLRTKVGYARDALGRGSDAVWVHYTKSSNLVSFSVVCCPQRFLPEIQCPLPPL
ncbi:hypothetical protein P3L51_14110 [Streptomyces sp. PSRA5]|uniref:hypothetical protein n=1 Tax=Streptomyces panacea TaxID=3035064 RepID=UPI00339D00FC